MRREYNFHVYLLTNFTNRVIYTGVTNNLKDRLDQHRGKSSKGFTNRYSVWKLVYYEEFGDIREAISREKQIKAGPGARRSS